MPPKFNRKKVNAMWTVTCYLVNGDRKELLCDDSEELALVVHLLLQFFGEFSIRSFCISFDE